MATFSGGETIVQVVPFYNNYTSGTVYTVPASTYAKISLTKCLALTSPSGDTIYFGGRQIGVSYNTDLAGSVSVELSKGEFILYAGQTIIITGQFLLNMVIREFSTP